MLTIQGYKELIEKGCDPGTAGDLVAMLPRQARIELRKQAEAAKLPLVRTMWFDYETQEMF